MSAEALVRIPNSTVYQVEHVNNAVTSIANGDFLITYDSSTQDAGLQAQVGSVRWALGSWSATLRFNDHTYAFQLPPQQAAVVPYYYCVMLSPKTSLELLELLQAVLASATAYHDQAQVVVLQATDEATAPPLATAPTPTTSDKVASGLQRGGQLAAAGVLAAAGWAGKAIHKGAEAAVARMAPADRPSSVSPEVQARLEKARDVAAKAAELSGRAVGGALTITAQVASSLAARIAKTDLGKRLGDGKQGKTLRKVGEAGVDAVEAVYDSLAAAARVVLAHSTTAATRMVGHKFGSQAGQVAGTSMQVAANVVETGLNVYKLRPTALAKEVIKGTAQQVVTRANDGNGNGNNNGNGAAAATMTLAALTADGGQPQQPQQQPVAVVGGGCSGGALVEGVVVTGPALAQPVVHLADYTPSAAVFYGSGTAGGTNAGTAGAACTAPPSGRYYPAIPRA